MKKQILITLVAVLFVDLLAAQEIKEVVHPLSKNASKGILSDVQISSEGLLNINYRVGLDKQKDVVTYEDYLFDNNLTFSSIRQSNEVKEKHSNRTKEYFSAYIGGVTSFDILSQKLKIYSHIDEEYWDYSKQVYKTKKVVSKKTINPRNDNGKTYNAYADFWENDDNGVKRGLIVAKVESKGESPKQYLLLAFNENLELTEIPLGLHGEYTLVFAKAVNDTEIVMIYAPQKGNGDATNYVYYKYDIQGKLINSCIFNSPASALLISAVAEKNDEVFLFGTSQKSKNTFEKQFSEFSPIFNPGSLTSKMTGANYLDQKWRACFEKNMDYFHLLKFEGDKLVFSSTTSVKDLKNKFQKAPNDKKATMYQGKKFLVDNLYVAPSGDYLVSGQLTASAHFGLENRYDAYKDIVCFHFDKDGLFKSQFAVSRLMDQKDSEMSPTDQNFYASADGKTIYWMLYEPKAIKTSYADLYFGVGTTEVRFPRIATIDLQSDKLLQVRNIGDGKYFINGKGAILERKNNLLLIGGDLKEKNLWIGKIDLR